MGKALVVIIAVAVLFTVSLPSDGFGGGIYVGGVIFPFPYAYSYPYPFAYFPFPYAYPYPYYYPYGYPSYSYSYSQPAQVYVEAEQPYYWYYCKDSQTYYPYVTSCPGGWMKVIPAPPETAREDGKR